MTEQTPLQTHGPEPDSDQVVVGLVRSPWGIRGDLIVDPLTDFPQRFATGNVLYLDGRPTRVERSRSAKRGVLVKLDLVNDRTQADSQRGKLITVPATDTPPLPEGSFYHFQVIGVGVRTDEGEYLGEVTEILSTGSNDVYVVAKAGAREVLIPALASVVVALDPDAKKMVVKLPQGLR